jgi:hypothetical protein
MMGKVYDAETGEDLGPVFLIDTETNELGRYERDPVGAIKVVRTNDFTDAARAEVVKHFETRRVRVEPSCDDPIVADRLASGGTDTR